MPYSLRKKGKRRRVHHQFKFEWTTEKVYQLLKILRKPDQYRQFLRNKIQYSQIMSRELFGDAACPARVLNKINALGRRYTFCNRQLAKVESGTPEHKQLLDSVLASFPFYYSYKAILDPDTNDKQNTRINATSRVITNEPVDGSSNSNTRSDHHNHFAEIPCASTATSILDNPNELGQRLTRIQLAALPHGLLSADTHARTQQRTSTMQAQTDGIATQLQIKKMEHEERMAQYKIRELELMLEIARVKQSPLSAIHDRVSGQQEHEERVAQYRTRELELTLELARLQRS